MSRSTAPPILSDDDIARVISHPKFISDPSWRNALLAPTDIGYTLAGRYDLDDIDTGPVRGRLHIYTRKAASHAPGEWSTGLVFTTYGGHSYRVIRCNGPHRTKHKNTLEGDGFRETPHVHLLTERYQAIGKFNSGYAYTTDRYTDLEGALTTLQTMVNLQGDGILLYPER